MNSPFTIGLAVVLAYLIGSIPFGVIIVRIKTGQDVRTIGSGRTGGTNAMRAAGAGAGFLTALLDGLKVTIAILLASWITNGNHWAEALAGAATVLGHNKPIFLARMVTAADGRRSLEIRGGAGGAPAIGGALGLWPYSILLILPMGLFIWLGIGYASVATLSVGLVASIVFGIGAYFFGVPPEYVIYGLLTFALQAWALRPNIRRLMNGTEPMVERSWRGRQKGKYRSQSSNAILQTENKQIDSSNAKKDL